MSFTVEITVQREFRTASSPEDVFRLLADVPRSASYFPQVLQLVDLGDNAYRWEMEKIGVGDYTLQQTIYASRYTSDPATLSVSWTPVEGVGNALVEGHWTLASTGGGTAVALYSKGLLTVELPGFLQFLLSPLVTMEFEGLIDRYIRNLSAALGPE
ncbi:SRPBCC family protein [Pelodictyon luteolum]|uniref:SRPBCC family protein n=1 Tax=Chlorobium luteolum (strain DSM 273 / BCRC 81028 / 2530) TaxID=319225 RepID=Q3B629_CHLL3|nr:SRPBCC family protein [Pelodictyon luteolum]ABB23202.1 hypothetical protein Plut_0314 [Pelodictyon luteolum DSM 273]